VSTRDGKSSIHSVLHHGSNLTYHRLLRGANSSSSSNKNPENEARDLIIMAVLIEHPHMGLILFETGCAEDVEIVSAPTLPESSIVTVD
jgi:hypothetical protein